LTRKFRSPASRDSFLSLLLTLYATERIIYAFESRIDGMSFCDLIPFRVCNWFAIALIRFCRMRVPSRSYCSAGELRLSSAALQDLLMQLLLILHLLASDRHRKDTDWYYRGEAKPKSILTYFAKAYVNSDTMCSSSQSTNGGSNRGSNLLRL
jgi:hypothetical protein